MTTTTTSPTNPAIAHNQPSSPKRDALTEVYRYRLRSTGASSQRLGNCGVCGQYASDVFIQTEERFYRIERINHEGWTRNKCFSYFGHKECLEAKQR